MERSLPAVPLVFILIFVPEPCLQRRTRGERGRGKIKIKRKGWNEWSTILYDFECGS
jgi:hypothetical protein